MSKKTKLTKEQLDYDYVGPSPNVSVAFDLLFAKTAQILKNKRKNYEVNINLWKSLHVTPGKGGDGQ